MKRAASIVIACLPAALAVGCGSGSGYAPTTLTTVQAPPPANVSSSPPVNGHFAAVVTMKNLAFAPQRATVRVGQTVEWVNHDNAVHNVTSTDGSTIASPNFGGGGRFSFRPEKAGTIHYYCTIHASAMEGVLVVKG